ncbi:MAG TPA: divalent-cation tolerance protein CutA [Chthoniobacteraceae bacterium]|nr:divalent-cation tolerance protein CutA [Chthoniobacteraceae bacterium]
MTSDVRVVLSTFPSIEEARTVCRRLVEERLAACANLLPAVESIYRWQGVVETATETMAILKTTAEGFAKLEARLRELHSYEVPEIVALPVHGGSEAYLRWVGENVVGEP